MEMLPEEDVTGYMVRLSLGIGQSKEVIRPPAVAAGSTKPGWILPTGLDTVFPQLGLNITAEEIYRKNTRGPLFERFVDIETVTAIRHNHFVEAVGGLAGRLGINSHATRGRMAVCTECVKTNLKEDGYAIWHRLWLMPGSRYCHVHQRPLFTYCQSCEDGHRRIRSNWAPGIRCVCGKSLKPISKHKGKTEELLIGTATIASLAIQENFHMDLSGPTVVSALRQRYGDSRIEHTHPHLLLAEAFNDIAGSGAMELLGIKSKTLKRLVGASTFNGPVTHPLQVIAAIHVTYGGLPEFGIATSPNDVAETVALPEVPRQEQPKRRPSGATRALKGDAYVAKFYSYPVGEQERITRESREWLLALIAVNPHVTRSQATKSKGDNRRGFHLRHLHLIDSKWFDETLPAIPPGTSMKKVDAKAVSLAIAHIKARYKEAVATRPLERITKTALICHLPCESSPNLVLETEEVRAALEMYADDIPKRRLRVTQWLCAEVQQRHPGHTYAIFDRYASRTHLQFRKRFAKAKKWLNKFDKK